MDRELLSMQEPMTRSKLRWLIDPELIGEISSKPIRPMPLAGYILRPEAAWRMLIIQTVLPCCRNQIKHLRRYKHLLTENEQKIADQYARNVAEYESDWRSKPLSFPYTPKGFETLLQD